MSHSYDPTDTQAIERKRADSKERARIANESEAADVKWLMGSRRGRRVVWRLLDRAGVFRLSFNTNAMQMAFAEGNKNEGLRTLALVHATCPDLYPVMVKEAMDDNRNADDGRGRNDH